MGLYNGNKEWTDAGSISGDLRGIKQSGIWVSNYRKCTKFDLFLQVLNQIFVGL